MSTQESVTLGVVADTHGLLRPEVIEAFSGVDHILHLGDVGNAGILASLAKIAPVTAICGNIDRSGPCAQLPVTEYLTFAGHTLYLLHNLDELDLKPEAAGIDVVLFGHSHKPLREERGGVLYFNPGAAGPRRFSLPICVGRLSLRAGEKAVAEHIVLSAASR